MEYLVDGKGLLVDRFGAAIRAEARRRPDRCLLLVLRSECSINRRVGHANESNSSGVPYLCGFGFAKVGHSSLGRGSFSFIHSLKIFRRMRAAS